MPSCETINCIIIMHIIQQVAPNFMQPLTLLHCVVVVHDLTIWLCISTSDTPGMEVRPAKRCVTQVDIAIALSSYPAIHKLKN